MHSETTNRWLILEQDSDRALWTSDRLISGLVWNEAGFTKGGPSGGQSPAEAEICILFLAPSGENLELPDQFDNRSQKRWNVWCHYGRDISLNEITMRWNNYERLSPACKLRLSGDPGAPPLPFSRNMPQPWSEEFLELKNGVKQAGGLDGVADAEAFRKCLGHLHRAWGLATQHKGVQARVGQGKEALPALLAAQLVLESLHRKPTRNHEGLTQALRLCRESGLQAMAQMQDKFSEPVLRAFRSLQFTVLRSYGALARGNERLAEVLRDDSEVYKVLHQSVDSFLLRPLVEMKVALEDLIKAAKEDAQITTASLRQNPRHRYRDP